MLFAAITQNGRVVKIPVRADGSAGAPELLVQSDALVGIDGIEVDAKGNPYFANNFANAIQRIRMDDLAVEAILSEGLSAPANVAFDRTGKAIYVANLSTSAGFPQPYAPALVAASFSLPLVSCVAF
jgi:sugar lactone lactonase YvrE